MSVAMCKAGVLFAAGAAFVGSMLVITPLLGTVSLVAVQAGDVVVGRWTSRRVAPGPQAA